MALRLATTETKRIDLPDGDFIEVVQDISKQQFNDLVTAMPTDISEDGLTPVQGTQFQSVLFETFVKAWSLPVAPNKENYLSLSRESASLIDEKLAEHFNSLTPEAPKEELQKKSRRT